MMRLLKIPHIEDPGIRTKVVGYLATVFLIMYCFLGVATLTLTTWMSTKRTYACSFLSDAFASVYVLLAASLFLIITSGRMLIRICQNSTNHDLRGYLFMLVLTLSLEIMSPIIAHLHNEVMSSGKLRNDMKYVFVHHHDNQDNVECIEKTQKYFHCCGANNFTDVLPRNFTILRGTFGLIPESCHCDDDDDDDYCIISDPDSSKRVFGIPCYKKMLKDLTMILLTVRIVGPFLAVVQTILLMVVSFMIIKLQRSSVVSAYTVRRKSQTEICRSSMVTLSMPTNDVSLNPVRTVRSAMTPSDNTETPRGAAASHVHIVTDQSTTSDQS